MNRRQIVAAGFVFASPALWRPARAQDATDSAEGPLRLETVSDGFANPWSLAFLPDGMMLVTERPGRLRSVAPDGHVGEPIDGLPEIAATGQGGLLDIALHPDFAANRMVVLSFAEPRGDGENGTSVATAKLSPDLRRLSDLRVIFRQTPGTGGGHHFGARIVFDGTGALFVTLGDRNRLRDLVQSTDNHIGKIVRITMEGGVPPDNPQREGWLPEIWSVGHRNVQGATLEPATGRLWTVEHGARGGDELNRPEAGRNYGWPVISYGKHYSGEPIGEGREKAGLEQPVHYWDPSIAPSGLTFVIGGAIDGWERNVFTGALAGRHVARLEMEGDKVVREERLFSGLARFRDVRQGPDGFLYLLTDEEAPRGRVLRVVPA